MGRQQAETKFTAQFMSVMKKLPMSWWLRLWLIAHLGMPDYIGCLNGRFIAFEFKKSKKDAEAGGRAVLQRLILERIRKAGGYATMVYPENQTQVLEEIHRIHMAGRMFS